MADYFSKRFGSKRVKAAKPPISGGGGGASDLDILEKMAKKFQSTIHSMAKQAAKSLPSPRKQMLSSNNDVGRYDEVMLQLEADREPLGQLGVALVGAANALETHTSLGIALCMFGEAQRHLAVEQLRLKLEFHRKFVEPLQNCAEPTLEEGVELFAKLRSDEQKLADLKARRDKARFEGIVGGPKEAEYNAFAKECATKQADISSRIHQLFEDLEDSQLLSIHNVVQLQRDSLLQSYRLLDDLLEKLCAQASRPKQSIAGYMRSVEDEMPKFTAIKDHPATRPDELNFRAGDTIIVTNCTEEPWQGLLDGRLGYFPSNFVRKLEIEDLYETIKAPPVPERNIKPAGGNNSARPNLISEADDYVVPLHTNRSLSLTPPPVTTTGARVPLLPTISQSSDPLDNYEVLPVSRTTSNSQFEGPQNSPKHDQPPATNQPQPFQPMQSMQPMQPQLQAPQNLYQTVRSYSATSNSSRGPTPTQQTIIDSRLTEAAAHLRQATELASHELDSVKSFAAHDIQPVNMENAKLDALELANVCTSLSRELTNKSSNHDKALQLYQQLTADVSKLAHAVLSLCRCLQQVDDRTALSSKTEEMISCIQSIGEKCLLGSVSLSDPSSTLRLLYKLVGELLDLIEKATLKPMPPPSGGNSFGGFGGGGMGMLATNNTSTPIRNVTPTVPTAAFDLAPPPYAVEDPMSRSVSANSQLQFPHLPTPPSATPGFAVDMEPSDNNRASTVVESDQEVDLMARLMKLRQ